LSRPSRRPHYTNASGLAARAEVVTNCVTSVEEFVLVEDASDEEDFVSGAHVTIKNSIFLITIEDGPTHSTVEVKEKEDPSTEAVSYPVATARKGEDLTCPPIDSPSTLTTTARRRRKFYDKSSLGRSACLAQRKVVKDLGMVGNDGKLNEDAIQNYADRLKELLPPCLPKQVMGLKGRAFRDMVAGVSLPLR
ncbi:hypothetical protein BAE44_0010852, partial [Dichanthelium oligosanthes]